MPILHTFINSQPQWNNGFDTKDAILFKTPYEPEVIFIGTFNHGWPWNNADFFYGRGMYMWTIMANFFIHNSNVLVDRRIPPPGNGVPSLSQIFQICKDGKITFADIV